MRRDASLFDDLIGLPFVRDARGPDAYDCWGLVMEAYRRWHGVEVPDYRSKDARRETVAAAMQEAPRDGFWTPLPAPEPGSVLVLNVRSFGCHAGFALTPGRFLHVGQGRGGVGIERLGRIWRVLGVYRHA